MLDGALGKEPWRLFSGNAVHQIHAHDVAVLAARLALGVEAVAGDLRELLHELVELAAGVRGKLAPCKRERIGDVS